MAIGNDSKLDEHDEYVGISYGPNQQKEQKYNYIAQTSVLDDGKRCRLKYLNGLVLFDWNPNVKLVNFLTNSMYYVLGTMY